MGELDSVRAKTARAITHLDALDLQCRDFRASRPYVLSFETEPQTGDQLVRVTGTPVTPPVMPVIGDILSNFRSALDHLAHQLVMKAGNVPTNRTYFPIFNSSARYEKESPAQTKGMTQPMIDLIRYHQPCFGQNQYANRSLWALQEYGNIAKHRRLLTVVSATGGTLWDPPGASAYVHEGPVEDGTILARFPADHHKGSISSVPTIAFGEGAAKGEDIQRVLGLLKLRIPRIVNEFEAAFF